MSKCATAEKELSAENRRELLSLTDDFLVDITHQSLVDGDIVRDFILDIRNILNSAWKGEENDIEQ